MTGLKKHTLFPGQFIITSVPTLISTVLGSCVSVCLWDRTSGIGAMNHYLLPGAAEELPPNPNRGVSSTRMLIRAFENRKIAIDNLEAKVFGGCNSLYIDRDVFRVGERNIAAAMTVLSESGISVTAQHVGGNRGRKIVFNTATGKVRMRLLVQSEKEIDETINKGFGY